MDETVRMEGMYCRKRDRKSKKYRIDYRPLLQQLRKYVDLEYVLNLANHGKVATFALAAFVHLCEHDRYQAQEPDVTVQDLDRVLLALGSQCDFQNVGERTGSMLFANESLPPIDAPRMLQHDANGLMQKLRGVDVVWVEGPCGVGKSSRIPVLLVGHGYLVPEQAERGSGLTFPLHKAPQPTPRPLLEVFASSR
jgi:hypothetical protein